MISAVATTVKDAALVILMAVTLDRIRKGGDSKWYRIIFLLILLTL